MNWICSVAAAMVAAAVVLRVLWWAYERSHQLAGQRQSPTGNSTDSCQTEVDTKAADTAHRAVEPQTEKK